MTILQESGTDTQSVGFIAGARLVSDDVFADAETRSKMNPWSQKCLGGTSLSCDGLTLGFFPVDTAAPIQSKRPIHLRIEKKERVPDPNIKRTPFEEDNYVSTCWHRPVGIPLNLGPKCLRVLPPLASMIVNNITESHTGGKVLEGTVNRILLALKAGRHELCRDIAIRLSCTSFLVTSSGTLTKISANATATESDEKISVVDPTNHHVRTPVLVKEDKNAQASMIRYGYEIPEGWILADEDLDSYSTIPGVLNKGDQTYAVLDIFRPSPRVTRIDGVLQPGDDEEGLSYEHSMCQSEIEVSIRYRQERPSHEVQSDKHKSDVVVLTQKIAVTWSQPLVATFSPGLKLTHPCGNRHPTNTVPDANSRRAPSHNASEAEMVLVDGERVTSKCTLEAAAAADELHVDINEIRFEVSLATPNKHDVITAWNSHKI